MVEEDAESEEFDDEDSGELADPSNEPSAEESLVYLEPAAIGIEYIGLWDQSADSLNSYIYPVGIICTHLGTANTVYY